MMQDEFLTKIFKATQQMREQTEYRLKSDTAMHIIRLVDGATQGLEPYNTIINGIERELGPDIWYTTPESTEWKAVKFALYIPVGNSEAAISLNTGKSGLWYRLFADGSCGENELEIKRPATDKEIHKWYEEFLK